MDIGNSGDDTYFASPDLYKVNYVTVQEVGIQRRYQNQASGTVVEIVPDEQEKNFTVVSETGGVDKVQNYLPTIGIIGGNV